MTILITGGHLTPALGYIDYVKKNDAQVKVLFAGRKFSQKDQLSHEENEVKKRKVKFITYDAPRLKSTNPLKVLLYFLHFGWSLVAAAWIIIRHQPQVFLSFGGYLAVPMSLASAALGVPVITHEQTVVAGQANTIIAKVATAIAVSYHDSLAHFPKEKTTVTGNALRASLLNSSRTKVPTWLPSKVTQPIIYITGGNQGSFIINRTVQQILPQLTKKYVVIHACGNPSSQGNYLEELSKASKKLPATQRKNYVVKSWFPDDELVWIYTHCQAAVSRAGANTVAELTLFAIPSIYVPLPFAKNNEQELNIKLLIDQQASILLPQAKLTPPELLAQLETLIKKQRTFKHRLQQFKPDINGAEKIHQLVRTTIADTAA
ncbi:MAG TPA: glycosyltransferase [Patescibacteria group bacterium]